MTREFSKVGFFIQIAAVLLAGSADAVQVVGRESAEIAWEPASGPVNAYGVFVSRNAGDFADEPDQLVAQPAATVEGQYGDVLLVRVAAFDSAGNQGPVSATSEPIEFVAPDATEPGEDPLPDVAVGEVLYFEDFESYSGHEDPEGWIDTAAESSLEEAPALFETLEFADGNVAFGSSSVEADIHSHYLGQGSSQWSAYEYSGRVRVDDPDGSIGVTLYSGYPVSDHYHRLRGTGNSTFSIASRGTGGTGCAGATDTGVIVLDGAWYWFRFQAFDVAEGIRLRARVWHDADQEPSEWQIDCVDESAALVSGAPGVWSASGGNTYWDDLEVRLMTADADPGDPSDSDGDGWLDFEDNCTLDADADQLDTDSDGFGNLCDCDYDNNGSCDGADLAILGESFGKAASPENGALDMNGNGVVDGDDFLLFGVGWGKVPGPSGLSCAGTVPCP